MCLRAPVFLLVHTSLCIVFSFWFARLRSSFPFGLPGVWWRACRSPPVSPLALAKSVLLACLKVCLFCVGLFAVRFACVQSTPQKPTQQGLSCGCASLWPKRRARRVVELCSRARAALGKRQHDRATYKRTVNTLKEGTELRRVGFWAACFLASLRGGRGS